MATVIIKPYIDKDDTIGLGVMGLNSFPGTMKAFHVPEKHGRFLTGFDTGAFYLNSLDEKERKKEVERIKKLVEAYKRSTNYDISDSSPDNKFYSSMIIELSAENTIFDTNNPLSAIKLEIIKTNAKYNKDFFVAPSFIDAETSNRDYKFYISDSETDIEDEVSYKREINAAIAKLDELTSKDKSKYLLIIKYLLSPDKSFNTESDNRLYKRGDDYIRGFINGEKAKDSKELYKHFIKASSLDRDELIKKVVIKYAIYLNIIRVNRDKEFAYVKNGQLLGKTPEEVYQFLSIAKNADTYKAIYDDVDNEIKVY